MRSASDRPDVTVVIVNYNTRAELERCLTAVGKDQRVVVVDNDSQDGSASWVAETHPEVQLIANSQNVGFGTACNQGLDASATSLTLILNADAAPEPGAIEELASVFQDPDVTAAGGRLLDPNGNVQNSTANRLTLWAVFCEQLGLEKLFPNSRVLSPYWTTRRLTEMSEVEQVMGACLMLRTGAARFDERFFLYCEDTELCHRLRQQGKIFYVPNARFRHSLGASSADNRARAVSLYNRGKELYFSLHHGPFAALLCWLIDRLGALARFVAFGLASLLTLFALTGLRKRAALWVRVLSAPVRGPRTPRDTEQ